MVNEIIEKLRREKQQECETCSCSYSFWCQGYEKALDHLLHQVKKCDLADVGGSLPNSKDVNTESALNMGKQ